MSEHGWGQVCDELATESIKGLLEAYEVTVHPRPEASEPPEVAATIGFTSPQASGTLTLGMGAALVIAAGAAGSTPSAVADWAGELANQALGRFKNRLLAYGVELGLATPMVVRGSDLRIHAGHHTVVTYAFDTSAGPLVVHVGAKVDPAFVWERTQETESSSLAEGDFMML